MGNDAQPQEDKDLHALTARLQILLDTIEVVAQHGDLRQVELLCDEARSTTAALSRQIAARG